MCNVTQIIELLLLNSHNNGQLHKMFSMSETTCCSLEPTLFLVSPFVFHLMQAIVKVLNFAISINSMHESFIRLKNRKKRRFVTLVRNSKMVLFTLKTKTKTKKYTTIEIQFKIGIRCVGSDDSIRLMTIFQFIQCNLAIKRK